MRTILFRTAPVLIDGAGVVAALKDMDGEAPFTLYLENMDQKASLRTKSGSKNANLVFTALAAGTGGNGVTVTITKAAGQAASIATVSNAITINLACDSEGVPYEPAYKTMDRVNADTASGHAGTLVRASLAPGSDGQDPMEAQASTALAGGAASAATGAVTVEHSPNGVKKRPGNDPDFAGPWEASASAALALSTLGANGTAASEIDTPIRGLRVKVSKASTNTRVVLTAVRSTLD